MKNSEYWKLRFEQLEAAQHNIGENTRSEIESIYRSAQKQLESEIEHWYSRFAKNNGITLAEARQYLKTADLKELKWDIKDYIKHGEENALSQKWMKELENASAKYHISRLEALKLRTQQSLEAAFGRQESVMRGAMGDVLQNGYYHTAYELQKAFNIGWGIAGLNQDQIEKIISKPWAVDGKNFSERIWGNKQKLISEIHSELTQNLILGADPQKAIKSIAKKMDVSKSNAARLVMTEEAYFSSAAQQQCFKDLDVEEYEIVATLDSHTSDICRGLDGKHFPMKDFQAGVTAPPFHPWCRSTTCPYFDDDFDIGERIARDHDTGETYTVPENMTFDEWKEKFVDGKSAKSAINRLTNVSDDGIIRLKDFDIHIDKIQKFMLKPDAKHSKEFFDVGYTVNDGERLLNDIEMQFDMSKAVDKKSLPNGVEKFCIFMQLGVTKIRRFRTAWQIDGSEIKPRFITAYRFEEKGKKG